VIVDEATQALEPEIIICLLKKAKHLVLVGDKLQLGSMVVSKSAKDLGLDVSMIERFEDLTIPYTLLSSQYRMDPRIAEFSNSRFYERKIENFHKIREFPGFNFPTIVNSPLFFYHVGSSEEYAGSGASFVNRYEADVIVSLIQYMKDKKVPPEEIGVITFYDGQKGFLIQYLETHLDLNYANGVDVMSVDASQGREKGFIILSCVRSNSKIGVGFLSEFRRLNVAMTRAKYGLVVCGNAGTLLTDPLWTDLIKFFDDQGLVFSGPLSTLKKEKLMIGQVLKFNPKRPSKYADND
jgi:regulator of nonsense transcripts 1